MQRGRSTLYRALLQVLVPEHHASTHNIIRFENSMFQLRPSEALGRQVVPIEPFPYASSFFPHHADVIKVFNFFFWHRTSPRINYPSSLNSSLCPLLLVRSRTCRKTKEHHSATRQSPSVPQKGLVLCRAQTTQRVWVAAARAAGEKAGLQGEAPTNPKGGGEGRTVLNVSPGGHEVKPWRGGSFCLGTVVFCHPCRKREKIKNL